MASILDRRRQAGHAAVLFALVAVARAQGQNTDTTTNNANTNTNANTATNTQATGTQQTAAAATSTGNSNGDSGSLTDLPNLSTAASVGASTVSVTNAPTLSSTTNSIFHLSDVPTIAGYGIPTQVVPWTAGAPYMQTSKLPEGTVFIIVGAFLGTLGAAILLWRSVIAWSLHRSVKRAQMGSHANDSMLKLTKPNPYFNSAAMGSTVSLERLSAPAGKLQKPNSHGQQRSTSDATGARNSSLFFSPTAGAGAHHSSSSANLFAPGNRSSAHLPAGYYAAPGAASPALRATVGGAATSRLSSLNPMHPSNKGYMPQPADYVPSPPESPSLPPSRGGASVGYSRMNESWTNLSVPGGAPAGQRAPSANLEDLFENHGNGMRGDH